MITVTVKVRNNAVVSEVKCLNSFVNATECHSCTSRSKWREIQEVWTISIPFNHFKLKPFPSTITTLILIYKNIRYDLVKAFRMGYVVSGVQSDMLLVNDLDHKCHKQKSEVCKSSASL